MSSQFKPLEIPPGVVSTATKKMRSSNWSEVNCVRWTEGRLAPLGGQSQLDYVFASKCRKIHGWYDLASVYHVAYLCEGHLYVDTGGVLTDISPVVPIVPPSIVGTGGYSAGPYSAETYGTARTINDIAALSQVPDAWSLDNFGAILLAQTSPDGRLLKWDPAAGGKAIDVTTAPHGRCFVVTPDRFVMMFAIVLTGAGSFRRFGWCGQEDFTDWNFASTTNQAGFYDLEPASPIITALATRSGVVFWTAKKCYVSRFLGLPYVYSLDELADNCTPWSPLSITSTSSMALWMSQQGVFSFDGTSVLPVECPVKTWIDNDIDQLYVRETACAVHMSRHNEFWWFFPQLGSAKNTRAIIYNYKEGWWSQARMPRSAGITSSYTVLPIMADELVAYNHETGFAYSNADLPWADTFDLNLASGAVLSTIKQMIPDLRLLTPDQDQNNVDNLLYSLSYRNSRSTGTAEQRTTPIPIRDDGYVDFRTTGRDMRLRFEVAGPLVIPFTLGQHLIDSVPRGDR